MKLLRIGLIGAGRWGRVYLKTLGALGDRCHLTHVATRQSSVGGLVPDSVTRTTDWREVVRADCDAVIIAAPPLTHAEIIEACVDAGKPCIVEKPFCLDVPTAERLHRRVQQSGVPVLVNHTQLFNPAYRALKRAVQQAGDPVVTTVSEGMSAGMRRTDVSPLWDWGPHDVSLCVDLLGGAPTDVNALGGPPSAHGWPEMVSACLRFSGGAVSWISVGWVAPEKRRTFTACTKPRGYRFDDLAVEKLVTWPVSDPSAAQPIALDTLASPMTVMLNEFLDGLAGGDRRGFGTALAVEVVRVLAACESALRKEGACRVSVS